MNRVLHNLADLQRELTDARKAVRPAAEKAVHDAAGIVARNAADRAHADPQASARLHRSISSESAGLEAVVGSTDRSASSHELGMAGTPPRPILTSAAIESQEEIRKTVAEAVLGAFSAR